MSVDVRISSSNSLEDKLIDLLLLTKSLKMDIDIVFIGAYGYLTVGYQRLSHASHLHLLLLVNNHILHQRTTKQLLYLTATRIPTVEDIGYIHMMTQNIISVLDNF